MPEAGETTKTLRRGLNERLQVVRHIRRGLSAEIADCKVQIDLWILRPAFCNL